MTAARDLSRHAAARVQQRAIPPLIVQWLLEFGAEEQSHGALLRFSDKAATKKLARQVGQPIVDRLSSYLDTYLVEGSDGRIVTVGYRYARIRRAS